LTETAATPDPSPQSAGVGALGASEARDLLDRRVTTSAELVGMVMQRVDDLDKRGPAIRALITLDDSAIELGRRLDEERRRGAVRGPLHGVPVIVKDNIDTAGPLGTTAGSLALAARPPANDAAVVGALRRAGAIVVGKANLSEWANFRSLHSSSGWSAVGGQGRNPHALDRSPGGSSSGSAAAVAAGYAPLAVGTETDGSILCPAAVCGVVGIKPTLGLVSTDGVVPISASQDTVGPFARCVGDAALLLAVLAGGDGGSFVAPGRAGAGIGGDLARALDPGGLAGARIGVARDRYFGSRPKSDAVVEKAIVLMAKAGATIVDPADIATAGELAECEDELTVLSTEFKAGLEAYLRARSAGTAAAAPGPPRTLEELIAFNETHAEEELLIFGQDLLVASAACGGLDDPRYLAAREANLRRARRDGLDATITSHRLDAIAVPTMGPAWLIDHVNGDVSAGAGYQAAAVAGYPSISVPVGAVSGLPVGLCLMGTAGSDAALVRIAYALEQALDFKLSPSFAASSAVN
jgi:amidase